VSLPRKDGHSLLGGLPTLPPSLVEFVANELRTRLLRGNYRPGERLPEVRIAQELGVTRGPLREAMRFLQTEGLLQAEPRRGTFVRRLSARDIREIYTVRHALEELALELALPIDNSEQLKPLWEEIDNMRESVRENDLATLTINNLRFHRALTTLSGNDRLQQMYGSLLGELQMCMAMNLSFRETVYDDPNEVVERHIALLWSIEAGDPAEAKRALAEHGDRSFLENLDELLASAHVIGPGRR
jgi:DNA-binding GntR family transcriptional regulator